MFEEEILTEGAEEEPGVSVGEGSGDEYFAEDVEIEGLSMSDVELFLLRAELWDNLIYSKLTINEAQNIIASLAHQLEPVKTPSKRSRKRRT